MVNLINCNRIILDIQLLQEAQKHFVSLIRSYCCNIALYYQDLIILIPTILPKLVKFVQKLKWPSICNDPCFLPVSYHLSSPNTLGSSLAVRCNQYFQKIASHMLRGSASFCNILKDISRIKSFLKVLCLLKHAINCINSRHSKLSRILLAATLTLRSLSGSKDPSLAIYRIFLHALGSECNYHEPVGTLVSGYQ